MPSAIISRGLNEFLNKFLIEKNEKTYYLYNLQ